MPKTVTTSEAAALPRPVQNARLHLGYIDGLRAIAALVVVVSHLWNLYTHAAAQPGISGFLSNWLENGHLWVNVFIVISGFCLMLPVTKSRTLRGGWRTFYLSRARRILPPFYAAVFLAMARSVLHHNHLSAGVVASNLLLLQDVWPQQTLLNGPLWSVALEWKIYFLFPLFVWLWLRAGPRAVLAASGVLSLALLALYLAAHLVPDLSLACPWYVFLFALGMVSADYARRVEVPAKTEAQTLLAARLLLAGALALDWVVAHAWPVSAAQAGWQSSLGWLLGDTFAGLAAAALLFLLTRTVPAPGDFLAPLRRALSWPPLVFVGAFSYSLYLVHSLLVYDFMGYLVRFLHTHNPFLIIPLDVLLVLPLAYAFHRVFERPFMSKPAPKTEAQAEVAAVVSPAP